MDSGAPLLITMEGPFITADDLCSPACKKLQSSDMAILGGGVEGLPAIFVG